MKAFFIGLILIVQAHAAETIEARNKPLDAVHPVASQLNPFLFNQIPGLIKTSANPEMPILLMASVLPLSYWLPLPDTRDAQTSLVLNIDFSNPRKRTVLGVEYVF